MIRPPSVGPIAAAAVATPQMTPNDAARRSAGTAKRTSADPFGNESPPARAATTRKPMSTGRLGASAAPREAAPKPATPIRNRRRRPKRSPSLPAIGWDAPMTIRYAVTSQPTDEIDASKSPAISGIATAIIVELSGARSVPSATARSTPRSERRSRPGVIRPPRDPHDPLVAVHLDLHAVTDARSTVVHARQAPPHVSACPDPPAGSPDSGLDPASLVVERRIDAPVHTLVRRSARWSGRPSARARLPNLRKRAALPCSRANVEKWRPSPSSEPARARPEPRPGPVSVAREPAPARAAGASRTAAPARTPRPRPG